MVFEGYRQTFKDFVLTLFYLFICYSLCLVTFLMGFWNQWNGMVEWTTGMEYWNGILE